MVPAEDARRLSDGGATVVDVLVVVLVLACCASLSIPASATVIDASRARHAAGFLNSRFRLARVEAVNTGVHVGVVFDRVGTSWTLRVCRDGTTNGLRRGEIASGQDPCFDGPHEFRAMFPGVELAVDPTLRGPAGEPPNPDPVRLGSANLASFAPSGGCTPGSVFVRSTKGQQLVVRMSGMNGRARLFRYDAGARLWLVL